MTRIQIGLLMLAAGLCAQAGAAILTSPDRRIGVDVSVDAAGALTYQVARDGRPVILASPLGLRLENADFAGKLALAATSPVTAVRDSYEMAVGKRRHISYAANEQVVTLRNSAGQALELTFRVSNDGVAFRYAVRTPGLKRFVSETTGFAFGGAAQAWLQPVSVARTGWKNTNPSYEEHYRRELPAAAADAAGQDPHCPKDSTTCPAAGYVFPALFRSGETWVALTEAGLDGSFHASRLQPHAPGGTFRIGLPMAPEVFTDGALLATTTKDLVTPWRIIALGSLATLVESTLGTDLAAPAIAFDKARLQPGHASWSWALLKDNATVFDVQKRFIDYAADMRWDYTLVDADWDRKIGYDQMRALAAYAATRGIGLLAWYNSSGAWNGTEYSPKGALLTPAQRRREFARLAGMGVKGVKIDFFAGDGQSMIAYYVDILNDAAAAGLLVNFHGATLPRGWSRTWPNLMTAEAVRGLEFTTFTQADQDAVPRHAAMLPFTRNLFDPMDYTPMVLGDIPKIRRVTRNGFELAQSVLFLSGIQHFAEMPEGMATVPPYVKALLQDLPRSWDDVKFVDGYPGRHAVIARRAGKAWYVAGINADDADMTLQLDLSFVGAKAGQLIGDGSGERAFVQQAIGGGQTQVTIKAHGGFVAVFK